MLSKLAKDKCPPGGIALGGDALLVHVPYDAKTRRRVFVSFCISMAPAAAATINPLGFLDQLKAMLPGQRTRFTFWEFDEVGGTLLCVARFLCACRTKAGGCSGSRLHRGDKRRSM